MPSKPETRYAKSGDVHIAYQVVGGGPFDLVYVPGWVSNIDLMWKERRHAEFLERLSSFARLILFDKRGTGLSDPVSESQLPDLQTRMDDVRAVMDAAGSNKAALLGHSEGGVLALLFAATYPDRTVAAIGCGTYARRLWAEDQTWAPTEQQRQDYVRRVREGWPLRSEIAELAPSLANDQAYVDWQAEYLQHSASPRAAALLAEMNGQADIRELVSTITLPTLILHAKGDQITDPRYGSDLARRIPGAKFVELPSSDHMMWTADSEQILSEIEEFLTGEMPHTRVTRSLATVLFTDIVGSTDRAREAGDAKWSTVLAHHNKATLAAVKAHDGRLVKFTGDGALATFDGPTRAIRCAIELAAKLRESGVEIRSGLHTGECELADDDISGIAVHIAARVMGEAGPGQVIASRTVRDLIWGSGINCEPVGARELKGVGDSWELYLVSEGPA